MSAIFAVMPPRRITLRPAILTSVTLMLCLLTGAAPAQAAPSPDEQRLQQMSTQSCREVLSWYECLGYRTDITELENNAYGMVTTQWAPMPFGEARSVHDGIKLDADLLSADDDLVRHVSRHEWNHIKAHRLYPTQLQYAGFSQRAQDYYGSPDGVEVLTDCVTTDAVSVYSHHYDLQMPCGDWRAQLTPIEVVAVTP